MARFGIGSIKRFGGSLMFRIPSVVVKDDAFIFKEEDEIVIKIEGKKLVVEKA